ncbi:MAG: hypothetical protein D6743_02950 [Calditrichaeota bacterium]|nr:MAG: hypothetical protein D6743_02950 [Calditrichota bacterium]
MKENKGVRELRRFHSVVFVAVALFLFGTPCKKPEQRKDVVAVVGDDYLTLGALIEGIPSQIYPNLSPMELREFALMWIDNQVLYQEARQRKLDDRPDFKRELAKVKQELLIDKLIDEALGSEVEVSDEEVKNYYEANKESYKLTDDVVRANHILVGNKEEANEIRRRLRRGEAFADVARAVSGDSTDADNWDLGYFTRDEIIPELAKVVFNMPVGASSYPIKTEFGYHIVQVVDKQKKGEVRRFDAVKEEIKLKLKAKKRQDRKQRFLLQLKSRYKIHTNFQLLDSTAVDSLLHQRTYEKSN